MSQIKSQLIGLSLALTTALGCIAYEKLVKNYSYGVIVVLTIIFFIPLVVFYIFSGSSTLSSDFSKIFSDTKMTWYAIIYMLTWATSPIWYFIVKRQGILTGSIYEVKYIVILVLFYILFGDGKFTANTLIGCAFALLSIYFVSK